MRKLKVNRFAEHKSVYICRDCLLQVYINIYGNVFDLIQDALFLQLREISAHFLIRLYYNSDVFCSVYKYKLERGIEAERQRVVVKRKISALYVFLPYVLTR
jgi:hypothetical protein